MLLRTYNTIMKMFDDANGYLTTKELMSNKITMLQISDLVKLGEIERVTHGVYWRVNPAIPKPAEYKYLEVSKADENCIICADSALYYMGYIETEPEILSIATARSDRSRINVNFEIKRHYFSDSNFMEASKLIETKYGNFRVYDKDRSVCDAIRLRSDIDSKVFDEIISKYNNDPDKNLDYFFEYAKTMRIQGITSRYIH